MKNVKGRPDTATHGHGMTRQELLNSLRDCPEVSVLIAGGGINGAGLLRELALQGVDALLVDKSDFCAGASAASTRIIHGGLRYLENGEFRLVREALRERNRLLENAAHYVRPLPTTIPIFSWTSGLCSAAGKFLGLSEQPSDRGALLIGIGLSLYDLFTGRQSVLPAHQFKSRQWSLNLRPELNPEIVCTALYYDASISYPERLCLELIQDAEALSPDVRGLNYVSVYGASRHTVVLKDELSGALVSVQPRIVVNATGAWIDFTNRALQRATDYIGGTKGSHVVIDHPGLLAATRGQMLYFANADGRICIFYPYYGRVIAGSTDIPVRDPEASCDEAEVDYILTSLRLVFPTIEVNRSHIVFRFCGVRPLPRSNAATPGQISRDHICAVLPAGGDVDFPVYSLIGGKWTTFRAFGEQVADKILAALGRRRMASSVHLPIGGGKGYPRSESETDAWFDAVQGKTGLPRARLVTLLDRYGTRAESVAQLIASGPDRPLRHQSEYSQREIMYLASQEQIVHLDDLILRRTILALLGQVNEALLEELAETIAPVLNWTPQRAGGEVRRTAQILKERHGLSAEQLARAYSPKAC
jgi:glycerol-3-phosphate dehydrogenase